MQERVLQIPLANRGGDSEAGRLLNTAVYRFLQEASRPCPTRVRGRLCLGLVGIRAAVNSQLERRTRRLLPRRGVMEDDEAGGGRGDRGRTKTGYYGVGSRIGQARGRRAFGDAGTVRIAARKGPRCRHRSRLDVAIMTAHPFEPALAQRASNGGSDAARPVRRDGIRAVVSREPLGSASATSPPVERGASTAPAWQTGRRTPVTPATPGLPGQRGTP